MNEAARAIFSAGLKAATQSATSATKSHVERRILQTQPLHLFHIISDVNSYSQFLPLCTQSKVLRRSDCGTMFDAALTVGLPPLSEDYVSRVTVNRDAMTVEARSIRSNRFDSLRSRWKLRPVPAGNTNLGRFRTRSTAGGRSSHKENTSANAGNATSTNADREEQWVEVDFEVEMKVSDPIIVGALDKVLEEVAGQQVAAFEKRSHETPVSKTFDR